MPSFVGKEAFTFLLPDTSVITPIEPLDIPLSASMLLVKNITLAPTTQVTVLGKVAGQINQLGLVHLLLLLKKTDM